MRNQKRCDSRTRRIAHGIRPRIDELEGRVLLATFRVNTTLDSVVANLKTGRDAAGHISLRSAIQAANAKPNADTIIVPAGTYNLTLTGANEDNAATGDLDIKGNVTIKGKRRRRDDRRRQQQRSSVSDFKRQGADFRAHDPARRAFKVAGS